MLDALAARENFPVAARLLPARHRADLRAVYGFARLVDDIGDEAPPEQRADLLALVDDDLDLVYKGGTPKLPQLRRLAGTVHAHGIPAEPFRRLVEANRQDQVVHRYETFEQLVEYCALSADPVGRVVLHVFGAQGAGLEGASDRVCTALQIIEHCQDVTEDHARGRVYLPAEDLRRFGATEEDLVRAPTSVPLRRVLALQTGRAKALLNSGGPLAASLTGFARLAVAGYVAGGRAAVAALEQADHDVVGRAVRPATRRLLAEWPVAVVGRPALRREAAL